MKYMGSKRWMLKNGLGDLLKSEILKCSRFIDLFSGSGVVSTYVACKAKIPCFAYDIQSFSSILAGAIIARTEVRDESLIWKSWEERARIFVGSSLRGSPILKGCFKRAYVEECRKWCSMRRKKPITKAYGGHYFSPEQAIWLDALRATVPQDQDDQTIAIAALIRGASQCVASPGHTAQPFQPTRGAKRFIEEAWNKKISDKVQLALKDICKQRALCKGGAAVKDANQAANDLLPGDLVFIDPPYSGVHYSRFYHVLETIARGKCSMVSGIGRYPATHERPRSNYSIASAAPNAIRDLFKIISQNGARAIVTFPLHKCSNGLSGEIVKEAAALYFSITEKVVESKFSTLGGTSRMSKTNNQRAARIAAKELILILQPR